MTSVNGRMRSPRPAASNKAVAAAGEEVWVGFMAE
jgi:hypothetical protein